VTFSSPEAITGTGIYIVGKTIENTGEIRAKKLGFNAHGNPHGQVLNTRTGTLRSQELNISCSAFINKGTIQGLGKQSSLNLLGYTITNDKEIAAATITLSFAEALDNNGTISSTDTITVKAVDSIKQVVNNKGRITSTNLTLDNI
jgi:adhesin HecA-like repeat protein